MIEVTTTGTDENIETTALYGNLVHLLGATVRGVRIQTLLVVAAVEVAGIMLRAEVLAITIAIGTMTTNAITMKKKMTDGAPDGTVGDGIPHPLTRLKKRMIGDAIEVQRKVVAAVADAENEAIDDRNDVIRAHRRPTETNGSVKSHQWRLHRERE